MAKTLIYCLNTNCCLFFTFIQGHNASISCVTVMMDSRRIISADRDSLLCVWLAESGTLLQTVQGPYKSLSATNNMKFAVNSDNSILSNNLMNAKSYFERFKLIL